MTETRLPADGRTGLGIERLETRDVPSAASATYVTHLYQDLLGRAPDADGLTAWVNVLDSGSLSRAQVADDIQDSTEYRTGLINSYYQNILGRAADAAGFNAYMAKLQAGVSRDTLLASFYGSEEFFNRVGREPSIYVSQLYSQILRRTASDAEVGYWTSVLAQNGGDRTAVAVQFLNSAEFKQGEVIAAYSHFLQRQPDPTGFVEWGSQRVAGVSVESMAVMFMASDEYYNRPL